MSKRRISRSIVSFRTVCLTVWLIALAVMTVQPTRALEFQQNSNVRLTIDAGFDGVYRPERWVPIRVTATNSGTEAISGRIVAEGSGSDFAAPIELAANSTRTVTLNVQIADYAYQTRIELVTDQGIVAQADDGLQGIRPSDGLFGVVTESPRGAVDLRGAQNGVGQAFQVDWSLEEVPSSAQTLAALDLLILTDADTGKLSLAQRAAIADWVTTGGRLIVTGGPNWQKTAAGVDALLPIRPTRVTTLTNLPSLAAYAGTNTDGLSSTTPISITEGELRPDARVIVQESNIPLFIQRESGQGSVSYFAVDPGLTPFSSWQERGKFWYTVFTGGDIRPGWSYGVTDSSAARVAAGYVKGATLPDVFQFVLLLGGYIALIGPVNYLFLKRIGKLEWAWFSIPTIIIITSVLAYFTGFSIRGTRPTINRLALVQVWEDGNRASVQGLIGLLAPRRRNYDLTVAEGLTLEVLPDDQSGSTLPGGQSVVETTRYTIRDLPVDAGTTAAFLTEGTIDAQPLQGSAVLNLTKGAKTRGGEPTTITEMTGEVTNTTGQTLDDVVVLAIGGFYDIGTLNPGEKASFAIKINTTLQSAQAYYGNAPISSSSYGGYSGSTYGIYTGYGGGYSSQVVQEIMGKQFIGNLYYDPYGSNYNNRRRNNTITEDARRQELWRRQIFLSAMTSSDRGSRGTDVYVVGWTNTSPLDLELSDPNFIADDTTAWIYRLPVTVAAQSTTDSIVEVPSAFMQWTVEADSTRRDVAPYDLSVGTNDSVIMRFTPMPLVQLQSVTGVTLFLTPPESYGGNVTNQVTATLSLWDWQQEVWVAIPNPRFGNNLDRVTNPARFVGTDSSVRLKVDGPKDGQFMAFKSLDFAIFGKLANITSATNTAQ